MHKINTEASRSSRSMALEQVCRKESCESRTQRDTFWISWNIICKIHHCWDLLKMLSPRSARFREASNLESCINFRRKNVTDEQFPRSTCHFKVFCYNVTQLCRRVKTMLCLRPSASKPDSLSFKPKQEDVQRAKASPPEQQDFVVLLFAISANQAVQTDLASSTTECRQLRHRRLLLLEFLL